MKIPYHLFHAQEPTHVRNYLFTFGFLIVENYFSDREVLLQNSLWSEHFLDLTKKNRDNTNTYLSVPNYIERSGAPFFTEDGGQRLIALVRLLFGENAIYCGSSGTEMSVPTPWHRDTFIATPTFKIACYINSQPPGTAGVDDGGHLSVVPGSQHAGDLYADALSSVVHWPERFGICKSPVQLPLLKANDGSSTIDDYPKEEAAVVPFPYKKLKVSAKDLIIFDQRLVHGSTFYTSGNPRRMLVSVFAPHPKTFADSSKICSRGYKASDALLEFDRWMLNQVNTSECESFYDDLVKRHDLMALLDQHTIQYRSLKRTSRNRITMRDSLDTENDFNRRHMTDREIPVVF